MQPLDLSIVLLFLAANTLFGLWHAKGNKSSGDYFLGGHKLPWVVSMFSIVASETSVLTFVSVPGLAYRGDWSFLQLPLGYLIGRILVSTVLLPLYFRHGVSSIYQIIGMRFGPGMQKTASVVFLVTRTLGDAIRFLAAGVVVQVVTGWTLPMSIVVIGLVTLVYTLSGGIKAVVWLESFQFALYLTGGLLSIFFILHRMGSSLPEMLSMLSAAGKLKIVNPDFAHTLTNPMAFIGAFFGGILLSLCSHGVDYMMVQRVLGCSNLAAARKAMIGSGIFVVFQFSVFLLAGSMIWMFMHGAAMEKDREFASFIVHSLPSGLKGLLVAGVLSAAMSTHSSAINSLASSTVNDIMGGATLTVSRIISFVWAVVLIVIALMFDESDKAIVMVGLEIASFTYGGLLGLFLLSKSRKSFRPASLGTGLVASMLIVFLLKLLGLAWTWYIAASVATNLLVTIGLERLLARNRSAAG